LPLTPLFDLCIRFNTIRTTAGRTARSLFLKLCGAFRPGRGWLLLPLSPLSSSSVLFSPLRPSLEVAGSPQLFTTIYNLSLVSGKRHNHLAMSYDNSLLGAGLLNISKDGTLITVAKYSTKESMGVSALIVISCLSLVAILGLLVLMTVGIFFFSYETRD
jgi:hypothetical protein